MLLVVETEDEVGRAELLVEMADDVGRAELEEDEGAAETSLAPEMPLLFSARPRVLFR